MPTNPNRQQELCFSACPRLFANRSAGRDLNGDPFNCAPHFSEEKCREGDRQQSWRDFAQSAKPDLH